MWVPILHLKSQEVLQFLWLLLLNPKHVGDMSIKMSCHKSQLLMSKSKNYMYRSFWSLNIGEALYSGLRGTLSLYQFSLCFPSSSPCSPFYSGIFLSVNCRFCFIRFGVNLSFFFLRKFWWTSYVLCWNRHFDCSSLLIFGVHVYSSTPLLLANIFYSFFCMIHHLIIHHNHTPF